MADNVTLTRIVDLVAQSTISDGDYTIVDSANGGTKKYNLGALAEEISGGLTEEIKQTLLQIARETAYADENGPTYYNALYNALYPPADLVSISAVYTQSGTVYDTDTLDSLKDDLVVTAHYSDSSTETVTNYTLSGTLAEGTSTITVAYGGQTTTFTVTVSATYVSIHNSPMSWGSNSQNAFSYSNGVMTITGSGTSSYPGGALKGLKYTYNQIHDKRVRLSGKVTLTGDVTSGSGVLLGANLYTSANPANNGSSVRFDGHTVRTFKTSGTETFSEEFIWDELFDAPVDAHKAYYFGVSIMLNSPSGIDATIEDMSFEAVM